jgi:hypothetical protein
MTAAGKITTARLAPGARILVQQLGEGRVDVAFRKTGALVATVVRVDVAPAGPYGRQSRRVVVTDLGSMTCSPSQTHMLAPAGDRPLSTRRVHRPPGRAAARLTRAPRSTARWCPRAGGRSQARPKEPCRQFLNRVALPADPNVSCRGTHDRDRIGSPAMLLTEIIVVTCRCGTLPLEAAAHPDAAAAWTAAAAHVALTARPSGPVCTPVMSRDMVPTALAARIAA